MPLWLEVISEEILDWEKKINMISTAFLDQLSKWSIILTSDVFSWKYKILHGPFPWIQCSICVKSLPSKSFSLQSFLLGVFPHTTLVINQGYFYLRIFCGVCLSILNVLSPVFHITHNIFQIYLHSRLLFLL